MNANAINNQMWKFQMNRWQQFVWDITEKTPNVHTIYWFWDTDGGGFDRIRMCTKFITEKNTEMTRGENWDLIFDKVAKNGPDVCIVHLLYDERIDYGKLEQLKSACQMTHVIVFARKQPRYDALQTCKWEVYRMSELNTHLP